VKGTWTNFAGRAISQARLVPFSSVHNLQTCSPSDFEECSSRLDCCLDCCQIAALYFAKPTILDEITLKID